MDGAMRARAAAARCGGADHLARGLRPTTGDRGDARVGSVRPALTVAARRGPRRVVPERADGKRRASQLLPILSTPVSAIPEFIDSGTHGILSADTPAALAQAMVRIANDPAGAHTMARAAYDRLRRDFGMEPGIARVAGTTGCDAGMTIRLLRPDEAAGSPDAVRGPGDRARVDRCAGPPRCARGCRQHPDHPRRCGDAGRTGAAGGGGPDGSRLVPHCRRHTKPPVAGPGSPITTITRPPT